MVTVAENRERRLRFGRRKRRFPRGFSWKRWREGETSLRYSIEMVFLFERTGAALAMTTATAIVVVGNVAVILLLLVAAITLCVGCPRLAQAAAVSTLRYWTAFFVNMSQGAVTMVTAADPMTPDASFTSPLFTIDEHRCGVTEEYTCDDSRGRSGELKYIKQIGRRETEGISSRQGDLASRGPYRKQKGYIVESRVPMR